jgi:hypothetical protein
MDQIQTQKAQAEQAARRTKTGGTRRQKAGATFLIAAAKEARGTLLTAVDPPQTGCVCSGCSGCSDCSDSITFSPVR